MRFVALGNLGSSTPSRGYMPADSGMDEDGAREYLGAILDGINIPARFVLGFFMKADEAEFFAYRGDDALHHWVYRSGFFVPHEKVIGADVLQVVALEDRHRTGCHGFDAYIQAPPPVGHEFDPVAACTYCAGMQKGNDVY